LLPKETVDPDFLKVLAKADPEMAQRFAPEPSGDEEIAFRIEAPFNSQNFVWKNSVSKIRLMESPDISLNARAEYSTGSQKEVMEALGKDAAEKVNEFVSERNEQALLSSLPAALTLEPDPLPVPVLDCMSHAVCKARYFSPSQRLTLYEFTEFSSNKYAAVSNELVAAGWKYHYDGVFSKDSEHEKIRIEGPSFFHGQKKLPILCLIHSKSSELELSEGFADDFCQNRYADFISIFYARAVSENVLKEATLEYLKQQNLSAKELHNVYSSISGVELLDPIKPDLLLRFVTQLHGEPMSEKAFELYSKLADKITENDGPLSDGIDPVKELCDEQIHHLELVLGTNGFSAAEMSLSTSDRPMLFTISRSGEDLSETQKPMKSYILLWNEMLEGGQSKLHRAHPGGSGTSTRSGSVGGYVIFRNFISGESDGRSSGVIDDVFSLRPMTPPGDMTVVYQFDNETGELVVDATLNENDPDEESE
jgi:hypothetical protein